LPPRKRAPGETGNPDASDSENGLLALLDSDPPAWIITRTRRLAHDLRLRVAELRAARGREVADTPPIRFLADLLQELGQQVLSREAGRVLLSSAGEQLLWEKVISSAPGDLPRELLDIPALATTAADAWQRICLWGEPVWSGPLIEDVDAFRTWLPSFRARLDADSFITSAELSELVAAAIADGSLDGVRPVDVVVLGFERPDPALTRVVDALTKRGSVVRYGLPTPAVTPAVPAVLRAVSRTAEVRTVASRIRSRLLDDPGLRVAVLAPDLASYGKLLERVFEEELDPTGVVALDGESGRRFDFAEAPSLAQYPLVASALDLLSLEAGPLPFEAVSRMLLSPYPRAKGEAGEREHVLRAAVEARLRRSRSARLRLDAGSGSVAAEAAKTGLGKLAERLAKFSRHVDAQRDTRRSPSAWREEWEKRLEILEWPGHIENRTDRQIYYKDWIKALEAFEKLEFIEPTMEEQRALQQLRAICESTPAQPGSAGLSVKLLSLLDAAGLEFDLVFVIGMTASAFPAAPRPNPLLPVAWQRAQSGMPRASVEGERGLAEAVWTRVLGSAAEVFVTWPAVGDSSEENTASALVADLPVTDVPLAEGEPWWLAAARNATRREPRPADAVAAPLVRSGGSSILSQQSSCAFRAFAATRLGAERLSEVQPQPDAARRGNLVHAALVHAYAAIPSSNDLAGQSDANILEVARDAARAAVQDDHAFFEEAGDLEEAATTWLEELVAAWMLHERDARTDAWTVESTEKNYSLPFPPGEADPLTIHFRPDRIDRVGDAVVLLDFKTSGTAKSKGLWAGDRPDEPQLPLYLALLEQDGNRVDALAFANLSARDNCSLEGLAAVAIAPDCGPPGPRQKKFPPSYAESVASMRASVEALARNYLAGDVQVNPRDTKVCKYCGSHALCRVNEGGAAADDEGAEDGE